MKTPYTKSSPEEVAASPRLETILGKHGSTTSNATGHRQQGRFSVADHDRAHRALIQAERLAAFTLASIRGMTAEQVAAAVASRAIQALRNKSNRGGAPR